MCVVVKCSGARLGFVYSSRPTVGLRPIFHIEGGGSLVGLTISEPRFEID